MAAHRYWRVINIVKRGGNVVGRTLGEIDFINAEGLANDDLSFVISAPYYGFAYSAINAFDNDPNSFCASAALDSNVEDPEWWIGYVFPTPVAVNTIGLQMFPMMDPNWGHEWQSADVEYSDDGVNWNVYGFIEPKIAEMDLSYITTPVIGLYTVGGRSLQDNGIASRFVLINDWQTGDFIKKIVPSSNGEWEYKVKNQNPILVTHVGADGFAPQSDGGIIPQ